MLRIKNRKSLLANANTNLDKQARKLGLDALDAALKAIDPRDLMETKITRNNNILEIAGLRFNLHEYKNIYVVGGGKASGRMAEKLEWLLGSKIKNGVVNVPHRSGAYDTKKINLHRAGHPMPDEKGIEGVKEMLAIAGRAGKKDLIFCLISGGGSSLMPFPRDPVTLEEMQDITDSLLKSGATIREVNTVRKHVSAFKGGWLAEKAFPSTVVNLILSDVVGDPLDSIASGPTVPDSTTFYDAVEVLKRYNLCGKIPYSVTNILERGLKGLEEETPKNGHDVFKKVKSVVIGNNRSATKAAYHQLMKSGLNSLILTSLLEGEAKQVGSMLVSILREIQVSGNPVKKPCGIVVGGETTVTVFGKGKGGRNQEMALSAALKMAGIKSVTLASMSTDGIDGPTDAAGAIVDGNTINRSEKMEMEAQDFLDNNDSYAFFKELNDLIFTDLTETNVNDITVMITL